MSDSSRTDFFELADYLGPLRRRAWIVIVLACLGAAGGGAYAKLAPKAYTASAEVQVLPLGTSANQVAGRTSGLVNMDNAAQLAQSLAVATIADKQLGHPMPPQQLVKHVTVAVPANTTFLQINCAVSSPGFAARCANAFASAFLHYRASSAAGILQDYISALQVKINRLPSRIIALRAHLRSLPHGPSGASSRFVQINKIHQATAALHSAIHTRNQDSVLLLNLQNAAAGGSIVTAAVPPGAASSPRLLLWGPTGLVAGLVIGLVIAFIADRDDRRIHAAREVERFLDVPVLLDATKGESGSASRIAAPRSRTGQAFAELGQYVAAALGDGNHVLLVVGTSPGPGSSLVAANLAVALAWTRSDVVLVCADHTETAAPRLLGIGDGRGLPDLLAGTASLPEVTVQPADQLRLRVLPPGPKTPSGPYLQYEPCRRLIAELRREAGFVIIEAQSVGQAAETFALAEFADAALVAVEVGRTQRPAALDCLRRLDRLRTPVLGAAVLSAADARMAARARDIPQPVRAPAPPPRPAERSGARFEPAQPAKPQPADAGHGHVHVTTGRPAAKPDGGGAVNRRPAEPRPRVDATIAADRPNPARNSDPTDQAAGH